MRINPGGLYRCCIRSLEILDVNGTLPITEGSIVKCKYCQESIVLEKSIWKWIKSQSQKVLITQEE